MSGVHTDETLYLKCMSDGRPDDNDHYDESCESTKEAEQLLKKKKLGVSKHLCECVCVYLSVFCDIPHFNKRHILVDFRSGSTQMIYLRTQESQTLRFSTQQ